LDADGQNKKQRAKGDPCGMTNRKGKGKNDDKGKADPCGMTNKKGNGKNNGKGKSRSLRDDK
jgi:hypothetical protein